MKVIRINTDIKTDSTTDLLALYEQCPNLFWFKAFVGTIINEFYSRKMDVELPDTSLILLLFSHSDKLEIIREIHIKSMRDRYIHLGVPTKAEYTVSDCIQLILDVFNLLQKHWNCHWPVFMKTLVEYSQKGYSVTKSEETKFSNGIKYRIEIRNFYSIYHFVLVNVKTLKILNVFTLAADQYLKEAMYRSLNRVRGGELRFIENTEEGGSITVSLHNLKKVIDFKDLP